MDQHRPATLCLRTHSCCCFEGSALGAMIRTYEMENNAMDCVLF
jgi:hypothetical protein